MDTIKYPFDTEASNTPALPPIQWHTTAIMMKMQKKEFKEMLLNPYGMNANAKIIYIKNQ